MSQHKHAPLLGCMAVFVSIATNIAKADSEASNIPYVATDEFGRCYAHTVPVEGYGTKGKTDVYSVDNKVTLIHSYDWYAPQLFVSCNVSDGQGTVAPALVQLGPWARGHTPDDVTLAIAFHYNGKEVKKYSTLDIANRNPKNASCSVSHYTVISAVEGFQPWNVGGNLFRVKTVDGRILVFDATTGSVVETALEKPNDPSGVCVTSD